MVIRLVSNYTDTNNSLKTNMAFAKFLGSGVTFYDIKRREEIIAFLDTKIKSIEEDPDKKWTTTSNDYLNDIKYFFRWLYNNKKKNRERIKKCRNGVARLGNSSLCQNQEKETKRLSPYLETELWNRDELPLVIKYEQFKRNKAALSLFWDLDARNHEVTLLKIKHIRLREKYGEGEIPHEAKTGTGPILLTCSFPYVREWLNEHPFRNGSEARLICNLMIVAPLKPEAMWMMMKQLRYRIIRILESGSITDNEERQKLEFLLKTKKWNPYCIAILQLLLILIFFQNTL